MKKSGNRGHRLERGSREQGLSLIELVAAVALFAIMALGAGGATLGAMRANQQNENYSIATALAQDVLECVSTHYASVGTLPSPNCLNVSTTCMPTLPAGFQPSCTTPAPGTLPVPATMKSVQAAVTWGGGSQAGTVTLYTLLN